MCETLFTHFLLLLPESKILAKLHATQGYHQVPLEDNSSKLTTFLLPSGRFCFLRAPMGLLRDTSTKAITANLDKITHVFKIPISCRTDGRPQFRGPFDRYCGERGIVHEVSSPYNQQSNGHAEAAVKTAKH